MRLKVLGAVVCAATALASAPEADAYPIDCAILLCLGGGFPASAECAAAAYSGACAHPFRQHPPTYSGVFAHQ